MMEENRNVKSAAEGGRPVGLGILAAGNIASSMARTVNGMILAGSRDIRPVACASRDIEKARAFREKWGFERAYGSYEEMLEDSDVDLVYVASPHSHHYGHIKMCLAAGKHVLCEKSFTANAAMAEEVLRSAEEKGLLLTEAIWPRYMPSRRIVSDLLASGAIGKPEIMTCNLCYDIDEVPRVYRLDLCGGALMDVGVYCLHFASMFFGNDVVKTDSSVCKMPTGADLHESVTLHYADGRMAVLTSSAACRSDRAGWIYGTEGAVCVQNINNPERILLYRNVQQDPPEIIEVPKQITGYEYQVESCIRAIREGKTECPEIPHSETLFIMRQMDALRASWGLRYPFE